MQKLLTFFSADILTYMPYLIKKFNDTLTNDIVSFEQLGPACFLKFQQAIFLNMFSSLVSQKIGFDVSCKLSPKLTICIKCQSLFSGKNKEHIVSLSCAEFVQRDL